MASPSQSKVCFFIDGIKFPFRHRKALKAAIEKIFHQERKKLASLNYIFCSDKKLLKINQDYLNHDYYTDIISFDLSNPGDGSVTGEIYISIERVRENAKMQKTSFPIELHRVMFHGALHLCGYRDKTKAETKLMRAKENKYLAVFDVSRET